MSKDRPHYLTKSQQVMLCNWGKDLSKLFNGVFPMHVGSSLTSKDWFDVDVRMILTLREYDALSYTVNLEMLDAVISQWGQKVTGLPIDFQVQSTDESSSEYKGKPRNGMIL